MPENINDANTEESSSNSSTQESEVSFRSNRPTADQKAEVEQKFEDGLGKGIANLIAKGTKSTSAKSSTETSASDSQPDNQEVDEQETEETPQSSEQEQESEDTEETEETEQSTKTAKETTEEEETDDDKDDKENKDNKDKDKGPVPYARFSEIVNERNALNKQLEDYKPFIEAQQSVNSFCAQHGVTTEDFQYWLDVAALEKIDPEKCLNYLQDRLQSLQSFTGDVLSPELQKAVDDGDLTLAYAKKLMAAENRSKHSAKRTEQTRKQSQQQREHDLAQQIQRTYASWVQNKMTTDPAFSPKKDDASPDGLYELYSNALAAGYATAGLKSGEDLIAFAEKCYERVKKSLGQFVPKPGPKKVLRSNKSTTGLPNGGKPKTIEEAAMLGARVGIARSRNTF